MVDERVVPLNDPNSNYGAIGRVFFNYIPSQSFSMMKDNLTVKEAILKYESSMKNLLEFSDDGFPVFDLVLLGMGDDGHTASLFPGTKALKEDKKVVVENEIPQLNTTRITLTYPTILCAKEIIIIIKGETKKQIYKEIHSNSETSYPMQKVVSERKDLKWILED